MLPRRTTGVLPIVSMMDAYFIGFPRRLDHDAI
jgi:hypothetical protein